MYTYEHIPDKPNSPSSHRADGNHYLILNSKGNHFISHKANYQPSKYLGNEMNWDLLLYLGFLHGNSNLGFKQSWKRKINTWQRGRRPRCWPRWHGRRDGRGGCESVFFESRAGHALCTGCRVSDKDPGPQRRQASPLCLCSCSAAAQYALFLVSFTALSNLYPLSTNVDMNTM